MLKVLGFLLCGLLMSPQNSNAESNVISQGTYERLGKVQGIAFESEMSKFSFADLKVDSIAIKGCDKQNEGFCTILCPETRSRGPTVD